MNKSQGRRRKKSDEWYVIFKGKGGIYEDIILALWNFTFLS